MGSEVYIVKGHERYKGCWIVNVCATQEIAELMVAREEDSNHPDDIHFTWERYSVIGVKENG